MDDNIGSHIVIDGKVSMALHSSDMKIERGRAAYDVIRIIKGIPLFLEDHYRRLRNTFMTLGSEYEMPIHQLKDLMKDLLIANGLENCNIKIVAFLEEEKQRNILYISKFYYPSEKETDAGVKTGLLQMERANPNAKLIDKEYKSLIRQKMLESGYFEMLLVDSDGRITEGSRTNAFFVSEEKIYTAPPKHVLLGITRKYVMEACRRTGYKILEQFVKVDDLQHVDGAFISGTSINVMPISGIDGLSFQSSVNPVVAGVRFEYKSLVNNYLKTHSRIL